MRGSVGSLALLVGIACTPGPFAATSDGVASTGAATAVAATGDLTSTGAPTDSDAPPGCPVGDVIVEAPSHLDALVGCTDLPGDLWIIGPITDLTPLTSLRHVAGELKIDARSDPDTKLLSLAGLEGLESVGSLLLEGLDVTDLQPLAGLTDIPGYVGVVENPDLQTLAGLHNLTHVGGLLQVGYSPQLTDLGGLQALERVDGGLYLQELPLVDLHGLESLTDIGVPGGDPVEIWLRDLPQLTSADALAVLWHGAHAIVIENTALHDLSLLAGADALNHLSLHYNPELADLGGLESLMVIHDGLTFSDNDQLDDISALSGLQSVGTLSFSGDEWLLDLSSLTSLTTIGRLFSQNHQMKDLGPFPALEQVGSLWIRYTGQLESLSGLAGITTLDSLRLDSNLLLSDLSGLASLAHVEGDVVIRENVALPSLGPLAALTSVGGDLTVVMNPSLPQVDAEAWGAPIAVGLDRKIAGNKDAGPPKDPCPWSSDGECDEPSQGVGICADKSDPNDCCEGACR